MCAFFCERAGLGVGLGLKLTAYRGFDARNDKQFLFISFFLESLWLKAKGFAKGLYKDDNKQQVLRLRGIEIH